MISDEARQAAKMAGTAASSDQSEISLPTYARAARNEEKTSKMVWKNKRGLAQNISHPDLPVLNAESSCCSLFDAASSLVGFVWTSVIIPSLFFFSFLSFVIAQSSTLHFCPSSGLARLLHTLMKYSAKIRNDDSSSSEITGEGGNARHLRRVWTDCPERRLAG